MLVSVIIFLREVLEASLLISIFLAISYQLGLSRKWIFYGMGIGLLGAIFSASYMSEISSLFDGTGQEITNALYLISMVILIILICIACSPLLNTLKVDMVPLYGKLFYNLLSATISIAICHEGSELSIYSYGFINTHDSTLALVTGGLLGLGIGASIGALIYYILIGLNIIKLYRAAISILLLIAAGMISQATLYLMQSDWLPGQKPLWDTSHLISENSLIGQLLYALIGYEATPYPLQVILYLSVIFIGVTAILIYKQQKQLNCHV